MSLDNGSNVVHDVEQTKKIYSTLFFIAKLRVFKFLVMETIDYKKIISEYPWITSRDQKAILSPDMDGLLCGLLMSHYLNWSIVGFYDGKFLLLKEKFSTKSCIFLDMEILRKNIRSIGHHMNVHNFDELPVDYNDCMLSCINPNQIRGFDRIHKFPQKYPLGTIHLLMYILETEYPGLVKIRKEGLTPIFFADGVWKILFKYTSNVLDWFYYLHSDREADWWLKLKQLSVIDLIKDIENLLKKFKKIEPNNKNWYGHIDISVFPKQKDLLFDVLELLSRLIGWKHDREKWDLYDLKEYKFTKEIYGQDNFGSRSNEQFFNIWNKKPLSLAMTEGTTIQYTIEGPDKLP